MTGYKRAVAEAAAVSVVLALGWTIIALLNPAITYHFASIIVTMAPPFYLRVRTEKRLAAGRAVAASTIGAVVALAAVAVIAALHSMRGPTFLHLGSPLVESLAGIGVGLVAGFLLGTSARRQPRS